MSKARVTTDEQPSVWQDPLFVALFIINIIVVIVAIVVLLKLYNRNLKLNPKFLSNDPKTQKFLNYCQRTGIEVDENGARM